MTITPEREPTIADVLEKLNDLSQEVTELSGKVKKLNDKFSNYITPKWMIRYTIELVFSLIFGLAITQIIYN